MRISKFTEKRAQETAAKIVPYLKKSDRILDIGCGDCYVAKALQDEGHSLTGMDIKDVSHIKTIKPLIYDGKNIPFERDSFDVSLLSTVLHHIKEPVRILREAARVAPRIIVIEDLYKGAFQKYLTFIMDSVVNLEFFGHPHTNKTQEEWEDVFKKLNLKIIDRNMHNFWIFFTSGTFYLERQ